MCAYLCVRTTIEIPDELFRRSKQAALARGVTLKELVTRALRKEVEEDLSVRPRELEFPLIKTDRPGSIRVGKEDIEALEIDEDARR